MDFDRDTSALGSTDPCDVVGTIDGLGRAAPDRPSTGVLSFDGGLAVTFADEPFRRLLNLPHGLPDRPGTVATLLAASQDVEGEAARRVHDACLAAVTDAAGREVSVPLGRPARDHLVRVVRTGPDTWTALVGEAAPGRAGPTAPVEAGDPLTGLADRALFGRRLAAALCSDAATPAVLLIDLDRFKPVNDTLGHPVGDALLRLVAKRLRSLVRAGDLVSRLGGDEFAVLVPASASEADLAALARRVVDVLGRPFLVDGHLVNVGASVGVARAPGDGRDQGTLIRHADLALYHAKNAGRNTFSFFETGMGTRALARRDLEIDLRKALPLREFELFYQPQIDLDRDRVVGFEALMRWRHPVRGLVSPAAFIPLAEEIGFIVPIGEWALREACREASRWPDPIAVAVNVSPRQFEDGAKLVAAVARALEASGLPGPRLEVEVTESALLRDEHAVLATLHALRALGVKIAMDDFGTGYSSLSQLHSFPFDKIKIDRSFVSAKGDVSSQNAIIRAITALGGSLGMATIAEGVETVDQLARIRAEGCGSVQGYLFSKPVPAGDLDDVIVRFGPRLNASAA